MSVKVREMEGCVYLCGMCPSCAFAPAPPGSTRRLWRASDAFRRGFVVGLLSRCRSVPVLENIQSGLGFTESPLFTYARARSPASPQSPRRAPAGRPLGVDVDRVMSWFSSSPDRVKSRYLFRIFSFCEPELLRMVANLTNVLLVRQKRGFLQFNVTNDQDSDEDSEDPALMVVPGSSKSMSGVSRYRDFIGVLPDRLSKRILGLLDEATLQRCQKVCGHWHRLAKETLKETKLRSIFRDQAEAILQSCKVRNVVSSTYASIVEVPVPVKDGEKGDEKVKIFQAAYANINTKTVRMEERNVYCGVYFTTVLLNSEDPHRVVDYRGGSLMAIGSKDSVVRLFHVASQTKEVAAMKGHTGSIRALLLCQDRGLLVTAGCDASIRCWSLETDECVMELCGHSSTINSLDAHDHRLVSGAKDRTVRVWSLQTGENFKDLHFRHPSSVQCVRISRNTVFSSCERGLVRTWDLENATLLRTLDAHRASVKCLFVDDVHFLSGDCNGRVMVWSTNCDANECLMTFDHPKEVKSLALLHLRVITGCSDGKIRVFNFLTGECLRDVTSEAEPGRILSLQFHDNQILVNATSGVKLYQFAKVFWDYADGDQGSVVAQPGPRPGRSTASLRKLPVAAGDHVASSHRPKKKKKPESARGQGEHRGVTAVDQSLLLSEKAASERMKRRGLHHPLTRDSMLLKVNAMQRALRMDAVGINMEHNARLRDAWGPQDPEPSPQSPDLHPRRAQTCGPGLKSRNVAIGGRDVRTAPDATRRHCPQQRMFVVTALPNPQRSKESPLPGIRTLEDRRVKVDLVQRTQKERIRNLEDHRVKVDLVQRTQKERIRTLEDRQVKVDLVQKTRKELFLM